MRKTGVVLLFAFLFAFSGVDSQAQIAGETIALGDSVVALNGPWRFAPGDSPWVNGAFAWAQPGFDDSKWAEIDLQPKAGAKDMALGGAFAFVPGWTNRGYPDLTGFAWYRLRVRVKDAAQPLWLKMPVNVDDVYQIFANGRYVGQFGQFETGHVTLYNTRPLAFALPPQNKDGEIELALRFYLSPMSRFVDPDVGGMHMAPVLGLESTVQLLLANEKNKLRDTYLSGVLRAVFFLMIAPLALWAWLANRREQTYLWLLAVLLAYVARQAIFEAYTTSDIPVGGIWYWVCYIFLDSLFLPLWAMFWWCWFELKRKVWIPRVVWLLFGVQCSAAGSLLEPVYGRLVPFSWAGWLHPVELTAQILLGVVLLVILAEGFRKDRTEALLALLPVLLTEYTSFWRYLLVSFGVGISFSVSGIGIQYTHVASVLMVMVIIALTMRRYLQTQLERKRVEQDLEQARELQQRVLVPEAIQSRCFAVETEYRAAQTVGGDFFQVMDRPDGSLLVVLGDVSGKGISAAMLVAVLVGAIRTRADENWDPAGMLEMLNQRLAGRAGGHFATCIVAVVRPDGTVLLANAGHLPPYLNGKEVELEGSLPLGMVSEASYSTQTMRLRPGDRLTLLTDGVVEATNGEQELFGFDRARDISRQPAKAIVEQAQAFGQSDDITVVSIMRKGAEEPQYGAVVLSPQVTTG